ncbi:MAG: phenylalanine--tRNA ligase subunit alpha, partial [Ilumatobacteraceae bacterium]
MIDDIRAARDAALTRISAADDLATITALDAALLGKRGDLAVLKTKLGSLATVDEKRAAGQAVNEAMSTVAAAIEDRRAVLAGVALAARVDSERLDLTEYVGKPRRGHAHVVT